MKKTTLFSVWLIFVACLAVATTVAMVKGFKIDTDFLSIFPKHIERGNFYQANALYEKNFENEILIFVAAPDAQKAITVAEELNAEMSQNSLFEGSQLHFQGADQDQWISYLHSHRKNLLSTGTIQKIENGQAQQIFDQAVRALYSPMGASGTVSTDPFGLFQEIFADMVGSFSLKPEKGYLMAHKLDRSAVFIRGHLRRKAEGFNARLIEFYDGTKIKAKSQGVEISSFGAALYSALGSEKSMTEVNLYGTLSFLAVVALLVWCFASVIPVLVSGLTILVSVLSGLTLVICIYGSVHILSLLLGISVLGIVTDYCTHFFAKSFDEQIHSSPQAMAKIKSALGIGFLTNMLTYLCFYFTDLLVLQQLSLFTMAGIFATYFTVMVSFERLPFRRQDPRRFSWVLRVTRLWDPGNGNKVIFVLALILCAGIVAVSGFQFNDDVRLLQTADSGLKIDEEKVFEFSGASRATSYFLVRGKTEEELLKKSETLAESLKGQGLKSWGISSFIPSHEKQLASIQAYEKLKPWIEKFYFQIKARRPQAMQSFFLEKAQTVEVSPFLQLAGHLPLQANWLGEIDGQFYAVTNVLGTASYQSLKVFEDESIHLVSKSEDLTLFLATLRKTIMATFSIVLLVLGALLVFIYGRKKAFRMLFPPVISALLTLVFAMGVHHSLNLFHILAVILIFCLGLDYSVFFAQSKNSKMATHIGIFISVLSTIGSFGCLALSKTHAVSSFGACVFVGICLCYVLSPLAAGGDSA